MRAYTPRQQARALVLLTAFIMAVLAAWQGQRWAAARALRPVESAFHATPDTPPARTWRVGAFLVRWTPEPAMLTVVRERDPGRVRWASRPGAGFLAAARGSETVTEHRGLFRVRDRLEETWNRQTVERASLDGERLVLTGRLMADRGSGGIPYTLAFEPADGALRFEAAVDPARANRIILTYATHADEQFHGFGEQFSHFNLKGHRVPVLVSEQGLGRGDQPLTFFANLVAGAGGGAYTTYVCTPHYITSEMRSLCLENYEYSVFDLRREDAAQVTVFSPIMSGRIFAGDTPAELIAEYTAYAGRMRPLPDWILEGAVVGMQGGTERVRQVREKLRAHGAPLAAFWLQDWVGQRRTLMGKQLWWNWELDTARYPEWDELRESLVADGIRLMTYVNPFLVDVREKENARRNLFREASEQGYLVKTPEGADYLIPNTSFSAGLVDLSNSDARAWMKRVILENVAGAGASGWMADFGEALPFDAVLASGESAAVFHNRYPEVWAELNREAIDSLPEGDELVFFMRAGYRHSPRHATLFWLGDQMVSWDRHDGIKSAVTGLLSGGVSGFSLNHSDIGGFAGGAVPTRTYYRSRELLMRWMELNAFTTIFRSHEGITPDQNAQIYDDDELLRHFARFAKVHAAWGFYRKALVAEAAATGMPVVRHLFLHYPHDPQVRGMTYEQFLVGDALLVAPVLDPGAEQLVAYLPAGQWVHAWSGTTFGLPDRGQEVVVAAPLGQPAVFCRADHAAGRQFRENLEAAGLL